jgi:hypothetical protein
MKLSAALCIIFVIAAVSAGPYANAQEEMKSPILNPAWIILQTIPGVSWTVLPAETHTALEWEFMPLLYSFGMNKNISPWHVLFATPPERFTGSIELLCSAQFYPSVIGNSHWGFSGQVLSHVPLVERGEYLGLNFGAARYFIASTPTNCVVCGAWTLFGFLHYNLKRSIDRDLWMHSIEFRFF